MSLGPLKATVRVFLTSGSGNAGLSGARLRRISHLQQSDDVPRETHMRKSWDAPGLIALLLVVAMSGGSNNRDGTRVGNGRALARDGAVTMQFSTVTP